MCVSETSEKPKFCFSPDAAPFVPKSFQATRATANDAKASTLSVEAREFYPRNYLPEVSVTHYLFCFLMVIGLRALSFKHPLLSVCVDVCVSVCMSRHWKSNISETKADRWSVTIGILLESGPGLSSGDVTDDVT